MTREEAIDKTKRSTRYYRGLRGESPRETMARFDNDIIEFVDRLVALSILKLDEPKTFNQKLCDGMRASLGVWLNAGEIERVQESFDAAGLRIVEK